MLDRVQCPAHRRDLRMRMTVYESRQDRRLAEVFMSCLRKFLDEFCTCADCGYEGTVDRNRAIRGSVRM